MVADLAVIVPTRGRPRRFLEMLEAIDRTAETDVAVWLGVDEDDDVAAYRDVVRPRGRGDVFLNTGQRHSLSGWTNALATLALQTPDPPRFLASLGDDHRPRTPGWDRRLIEAIDELGGSGIAYGNDLFQGERLPTAWVVSADIVRSLGWMMLPSCAHMYVDTATLMLGRALDRIAYCPDVVIEHVHPMAGKTPWDASYRESNAGPRYDADREAFEAWERDGLDRDVERVRSGAVVGGAR